MNSTVVDLLMSTHVEILLIQGRNLNVSYEETKKNPPMAGSSMQADVTFPSDSQCDLLRNRQFLCLDLQGVLL